MRLACTQHNRCEAGLRESLLQQLGSLASIVRQHIRAFLPSIFQLVVDYWQDNLEQVQYTSMHLCYIKVYYCCDLLRVVTLYSCCAATGECASQGYASTSTQQSSR
jgi:hypothetical protein